MERLQEIKKALPILNLNGVLKEDVEWLIEQAELLQKIGNRWIEIETNGTPEGVDDFYKFVQDTLSPQPE